MRRGLYEAACVGAWWRCLWLGGLRTWDATVGRPWDPEMGFLARTSVDGRWPSRRHAASASCCRARAGQVLNCTTASDTSDQKTKLLTGPGRWRRCRHRGNVRRATMGHRWVARWRARHGARDRGRSRSPTKTKSNHVQLHLDSAAPRRPRVRSWA
ncbi:hypothetical protein WOLCODRAFT_162984 [Wolfiporia cocos MD-104 SS10]|uniref:Secreted protein n=1 Tax=Wolfiporia cocos (strain MD-104) TaxID=742152 RepID=A0A2H3JID2_WOLCO|nr:hypothetical protein WOLCODRAFT_162984 [Wolfiporia cocos MD-104 SS10]